MDNRILELAGLPAKAPSEQILTESAKKQKAAIQRIFTETMSALKKAAPGLSTIAQMSISAGISDAYEQGHDDGYEEGSQA